MVSRERLIVLLVALFGGLSLTGCAVQAPPELITAIREGDLNQTKTILEINPKFANSKDEWGYTLLQLAVNMGNKDLCEVLIANGANLEAKGNYGQTALHIAVEANKKDIVELLVSKGANVNSKDNRGRTPIPCGYGARPVLLKDYDWDIVKFLIAHGAKVNTKSKNGDSPLHLAASHAPKEIVKLYLAKGADVNLKTAKGFTSLHAATMRMDKDSKVVELLIASGANINAKHHSTGETPLHWASNLGFTKAVELLIAGGADVNVKRHNGDTPLDMAVRQRHKEVAELLRKHGAVE